MSSSAEAMTFEFALPSLGADMDRGAVTEWCVAVGDHVTRGDVVAVVETEKSDIDVEIWRSGVVEEFLVEIGEEIEVGTPIARVRGDEPAVPSVAPTESSLPAPRLTPSPAPAPVAARPSSTPQPDAANGVVRASPYARRLAAERGIDLVDVRGSGPGGAVVAADVDRAGVTPWQAPATTVPPTSMRRVIAQRMATANREIPHYHLALDVDTTDTLAALAEHNEDVPISSRILPAALYVRAVALALRQQPEFNGSWVDDAFAPSDAINVAMAISLRTGGLVAPHVEHADELTLSATMERLSDLVAAARSGNLKARWMTGASITITNLGDHGADLVHGVISPPQVALVGIGRTRLRPWVVDGGIEPRSITTLTLAADHRATDGMAGSRFLGRIAEHLDNFPEDP